MNPVANKKISKSVDFEGSLKELEEIVAKMEGQELSLEAALAQFEKGISLAKQCQITLQNAKQRVDKLIEENDDNSAQ